MPVWFLFGWVVLPCNYIKTLLFVQTSRSTLTYHGSPVSSEPSTLQWSSALGVDPKATARPYSHPIVILLIVNFYFGGYKNDKVEIKRQNVPLRKHDSAAVASGGSDSGRAALWITGNFFFLLLFCPLICQENLIIIQSFEWCIRPIPHVFPSIVIV